MTELTMLTLIAEAKKVKNRIVITLLVLLFIILLSATTALAQSQNFYPAGVELKNASMESAVAAIGPSAVFYNPAGLWLKHKQGLNAEVGFLQTRYSYQHQDYDPVSIFIRSPVGSAGYSNRITPQWAYAISIFPEKWGTIVIPGLPRLATENSTLPFHVTSQEKAISTGIGTSYAITSGLIFGVSLIHTYEDRSLVVRTIGDESVIYNQHTYNQFYRPVIGTRARLGENVKTALSYTPMQKKTYKGSLTDNLKEQTSKPKQVDFRPASLRLGLEISLSEQLQIQSAYNHHFWKAGQKIIKDGLTTDNDSADLRNSNEWGLRAIVTLSQDLGLSAAFARKNTPWGEGQHAKSNDDEEVLGADFGNLDAISRNTTSIGLSHIYSESMSLETAITRSIGHRIVSSNGANEGDYRSDLYLISLGTALTF